MRCLRNHIVDPRADQCAPAACAGSMPLNLTLASGSYYNYLLRDNTSAAAVLLNQPDFNRTALGNGYRWARNTVCISDAVQQQPVCQREVLLESLINMLQQQQTWSKLRSYLHPSLKPPPLTTWVASKGA